MSPRGAAARRGAASEAAPAGEAHEPNLARQYRDRVLPALMKEFDYINVMQAPRVAKIVVNIGIGEAKEKDREKEKKNEEKIGR